MERVDNIVGKRLVKGWNTTRVLRRAFENIVGKGENAGNQKIVLATTMFVICNYFHFGQEQNFVI